MFQCVVHTCGKRTGSTEENRQGPGDSEYGPCLHGGEGHWSQCRCIYLDISKNDNFTVLWKFEHKYSRKLIKLLQSNPPVAVPEVWSAEGPVPDEVVWPALGVQSN